MRSPIVGVGPPHPPSFLGHPSSEGLMFSHIFGWTPGVEFEVQLSPWLPSALYGLCIRARLQAVSQKGFWPAGL